MGREGRKREKTQSVLKKTEKERMYRELEKS